MPSKIIFSKKQVSEIIDRYKKGEGCTSICTDYNVSQQTINRLLKKHDIITDNHKKHYYNEDIFSVIDSSEKAYWLGFIVADGYVNEARAFMRIKLQECDKNHLDKFVDFINGDKDMIKYEFHNLTGNKQFYVEVNGRKFVDNLVKLDIRQGKSSGKEKVTPGIPEKYIRDYIRGLWDGDGHIEYKQLDLISSIEVLSFVQKYFNEKFECPKNKICDHCNTFRIFICNKRFEIMKHLYYDSCISLERKNKLVKKFIDINSELVELEKYYKNRKQEILCRLR